MTHSRQPRKAFSWLRERGCELDKTGWSRMRRDELDEAIQNYERKLWGGLSLREHWQKVQQHCAEVKQLQRDLLGEGVDNDHSI